MEVPEIPEDIEERLTRMSQQLLSATQPIGLYLRNTLAQREDEDSDHVVVVAEFTLGDIAFSDRVQHPEKAKAEDETRLALAEAGMDDLDTDIIRERWEQWKKGGGDGNDDDPGEPG